MPKITEVAEKLLNRTLEYWSNVVYAVESFLQEKYQAERILLGEKERTWETYYNKLFEIERRGGQTTDTSAIAHALGEYIRKKSENDKRAKLPPPKIQIEYGNWIEGAYYTHDGVDNCYVIYLPNNLDILIRQCVDNNDKHGADEIRTEKQRLICHEAVHIYLNNFNLSDQNCFERDEQSGYNPDDEEWHVNAITDLLMKR